MYFMHVRQQTPEIEGDPRARAADRGELVGAVFGPPEPPPGGGASGAGAHLVSSGGRGGAVVDGVVAVCRCRSEESSGGAMR